MTPGQQRQRVYRSAVDPDLEVQGVSGARAGTADPPDESPLRPGIAHRHVDLGEVPVERFESVAVIDDDGVAVAGESRGKDDPAGGSRDDRIAGDSVDVD